MHLFTYLLALILLPVSLTLDDPPPAKPLTPAEAAKKVNEQVTVEMEVKSTGGTTNYFLNSEADYKSDKNFTVFVPKEAVAKFAKAKIDKVARTLQGQDDPRHRHGHPVQRETGDQG